MPGMAAVAQSPVDLVNPLIGTDSRHSLSNGNTYPAITMPWGMNCWTPQTGAMGNGWTYTYGAEKINGIKQTHQPSPWINDYGQFAIMPVTGRLRFGMEERASWFSHKAETVKPYYYSVYLADHDVRAELTPTERAAALRFTFPANDSSYVIIDALDSGSYIKVLPSERRIIGYSTKNSGGTAGNFRNYFILQFEKDFSGSILWHDGIMETQALESSARHVMAAVRFKTAKGERVQVRVASSFISQEQALRNLQEATGQDFETLKEKGRTVWNNTLSRIRIEGGTEDQQRTFYSCLYRMLLFPRRFYEIGQDGKPLHYSPYNGKVLPGYLFTDTGFWDTFRSLFPFLNLAFPSLSAQTMASLENTYKESGWLPEWSSPGHRESMIGSNSASIVADAYLKGIRGGYDINVLYEGLLKNAGHEGPLSSVGRKGVAYYNSLGYVPDDVKIRGNVARTLEYAYDDYACYRLARALDRPDSEEEMFRRRAYNYRHVFDTSRMLVRGKDSEGKFHEPFDPFDWGPSFTEGNSWHWTWSVFHDVEGLKQLMSGNERFTAMLDSVFALPPVFGLGGRRQAIHEMQEMHIANMGQYAHGNQPIQHMIYLYNYAGAPWKAQYWARETMDRMYRPTPDGYCGDEDNGQTSAWYVFSAMGFYPVCPVSGEYVIGSPLFNKVTLTLENGKALVIVAHHNSKTNRYIRSATFNGKPYTKNWLSHEAVSHGGTLVFEMGDQPEKGRGIKPDDWPSSMSRR
jgi:predicted alpha-1,2-mannosidase